MHAYNGFERSVFEARAFSIDISAMLCPPDSLAIWGWLRVGCYPAGVLLREVEVFPGIVTLALLAAYVWRATTGPRDPIPADVPLRWARRVCVGVAALYAVTVATLLVFGPWRVDLGFIQASVSFVRKPRLIGLAAIGMAIALAPRVLAGLRGSSATGFYLLAAFVTWSLALGPTLTFMGVHTGVDGPFA